MLLRSLVTIAALTISSVQSALTGQEIALIKQAVVFMTRPDLVIKETPEFQHFQTFTKNPQVFDAQLHEGFRQALTSLRDVGDEHSVRVVSSVIGYHEAPDVASKKIYINSMYSRLHDLAEANPNTVLGHLEAAIVQLKATLFKNLAELQSKNLPLMGDPKGVAKLHELLADFSKNEAVQQRYREAMAGIPVGDIEMRYMTVDQVNNELNKYALRHQLPSAKAPPAQPQANTGGQIPARSDSMVLPHAAPTVATAA